MRSPLIDVVMFAGLIILAQGVMKPVCQQRRWEGTYINDSLATFRQSMHESLSSKRQVVKALAECGSQQCNPFVRDCYGSTFVRESRNEDMIMKSIRSALKNDRDRDLAYCVFTVLNTGMNANDPPPTPFIDDSTLVFEYNRYQTPASEHRTRMLGNPDLLQALINVQKAWNDHTTIPSDVKKSAIALVDRAIDSVRTRAQRAVITPMVRAVIDRLEELNASSLMGTMAFTDSIAKFGMNRMMCRVGGPDVSKSDHLQHLGKLKQKAESWITKQMPVVV